MGFVRIATTAEIAPGTIREVQAEGKTLAVANVEGRFYAISNTCIHRGGPLGQGLLEGIVVTCPWHGWRYDVSTGKASHNQAAGVECYPVEVRGEEVFVDISGPASSAYLAENKYHK
jgi:nitrite reductase (NADH) small subunit